MIQMIQNMVQNQNMQNVVTKAIQILTIRFQVRSFMIDTRLTTVQKICLSRKIKVTHPNH